MNPSLARTGSPGRRPAKVRHVLRRAAIYTLLIVGAVPMAFPFYYVIASSLMTPDELIQLPITWWPHHPQWQTYANVWTVIPFARMFVNSIFVTLAVTLGILLTSSLAGFGFAKYHFKGRDVAFLALLSSMMVPFFVLLIPIYYIIKELGWLDTYQGLIVPNIVTAFGVFLLRQFIMTIPDELIDAARIDGARELRIYWSIILPLIRPALSALGIFAFIYQWENFLWPLLILQNPSMFTVPIGLNSLRSYADTQQNANLLMAGSVLAIVPSVIVFLLLQRQFVRGISLGGLKG
ncbi:MAG TPA: carbohydrate ABC transporter permease [Chloroflexota bacterium]|nr:carbohydrate ABC transporter permease [Chloroflexota bacterium]